MSAFIFAILAKFTFPFRVRNESQSVSLLTKEDGSLKGGARRGLTEAKLTEARFTEATCGISCTRFQALVRPKWAQDSLKHERLRFCLTEARAHERWTRIY